MILVDDLLHHGGRFEALEPMLREEGVEIKKLVLGMISGYGRDTMATKGVPVDSIYYIPNLRNWFVESTLYPFIGGDTVVPRYREGGGTDAVDQYDPAVCRTAGTGKYAGSRV